jgi:hypothetical protein
MANRRGGRAMVDNRGILVDDAPFLAAELLRQAAVQRRYGGAAKSAPDFSVRNANECELVHTHGNLRGDNTR